MCHVDDFLPTVSVGFFVSPLHTECRDLMFCCKIGCLIIKNKVHQQQYKPNIAAGRCTVRYLGRTSGGWQWGRLKWIPPWRPPSVWRLPPRGASGRPGTRSWRDSPGSPPSPAPPSAALHTTHIIEKIGFPRPTNKQGVEGSVPDPCSFDTDPDPAFRLNTDPDPGVKWAKIEKIYSWKN